MDSSRGSICRRTVFRVLQPVCRRCAHVRACNAERRSLRLSCASLRTTLDDTYVPPSVNRLDSTRRQRTRSFPVEPLSGACSRRSREARTPSSATHPTRQSAHAATRRPSNSASSLCLPATPPEPIISLRSFAVLGSRVSGMSTCGCPGRRTVYRRSLHSASRSFNGEQGPASPIAASALRTALSRVPGASATFSLDTAIS